VTVILFYFKINFKFSFKLDAIGFDDTIRNNTQNNVPNDIISENSDFHYSGSPNDGSSSMTINTTNDVPISMTLNTTKDGPISMKIDQPCDITTDVLVNVSDDPSHNTLCEPKPAKVIKYSKDFPFCDVS
jgi:hypothetical protein